MLAASQYLLSLVPGIRPPIPLIEVTTQYFLTHLTPRQSRYRLRCLALDPLNYLSLCMLLRLSHAILAVEEVYRLEPRLPGTLPSGSPTQSRPRIAHIQGWLDLAPADGSSSAAPQYPRPLLQAVASPLLRLPLSFDPFWSACLVLVWTLFLTLHTDLLLNGGLWLV